MRFWNDKLDTLIANIKYRSHVDSDSCLLAVCRWLIPHEVAPQQSFTMLQPANAKVIIKNGMTKNNHIYFILQFDPLKHSNHNSSCNLTYTPLIIFYIYKLLALFFGSWQYDNSAVFIYNGVFFFANVPFIVPLVVKNFGN